MLYRILGVAVLGMALSTLSIDAGGGAKKETKKKEAASVGTIEGYKNPKGLYRYCVKDDEGKTIAMPLPNMHWENKEDCLKAIDELREILAKVKPADVKEKAASGHGPRRIWLD